ncbi:MAG: UDP-glucose 4-epimerase GalE [Acholeplasmatales bacterium]|nr:MAG: UDP-glucose 4-epimerase GalE [Acholeplasmatales bacterium]
MNICVTGGAGYIGSHAVRMLEASGHRVTVIDNLSTGHRRHVPEHVPFCEASTHDEAALVEHFRAHGIEAVMHFAAFSLVGESVEKPLKYYQNNVEGTRVLLEAMSTACVKYLVFSSTAAVYGNQAEQPITESHRENPENPYGETKLAIEKMLKWTAARGLIEYVSLRYFNVAGAYHDGSIGEEHDPETHLIPNVLKSVLSPSTPVQVFGDDYPTADGTCIRDYIHVEDLIDAHIKALNHLLKTGRSDIFNLGSSSGYSVLEVIKTTEAVLGQPVPYVIKSRRLGDPPVLIASHDKAAKTLGWTPRYTLEAMIDSAYRYFRRQQKHDS